MAPAPTKTTPIKPALARQITRLEQKINKQRGLSEKKKRVAVARTAPKKAPNSIGKRASKNSSPSKKTSASL
jgi:hypothetical protein